MAISENYRSDERNILGSASVPKEIKEMKEIPSCLEYLDKRISQLEEMVSELSSSIGAIIGEGPKSESGERDISPQRSCKLAQTVEELTSRITVVNKKIMHLVESQQL